MSADKTSLSPDAMTSIFPSSFAVYSKRIMSVNRQRQHVSTYTSTLLGTVLTSAGLL